MIASYRMIYGLLTPAQKRTFHGLLVLMVVMGATELAGVALLLPFLAVVADPAVIEAQPRLSALYDGLGFQSDFAFLQFLGLVTFAIIMIGLSLRMFTLYRVNLFVRHAATTLGTARLRHYFSQSYEWFLDRHSADLSKSVLQEINEVVIGSLGPAMRVISNGAVALFIGAFVVMVDPLGAIVIGAVLGLGYGAVHLALSRSLAERGRDRRRANRERYQAMGEALGGIKEVKMLDLEASYLRKYHEPSRRLAGHQAALTLIGEVPRFALEALTFGGILLYTLWLLFSRDGQIQAVLPVLGAFAFAGLRLMPVVQLLFRDVSQIRFGHAALEALADDLREGVRGPLLTLPGRN
ncbi:MAG: ABC transporter transmembrane domain-containing protein, partial [Pseudomonadota bacterium]